MAGAPTKALARSVQEELLPLFEEAGFHRVGMEFDDPQWPVSGRQIRFERAAQDVGDSILIMFDKNRAPRVTISFLRMELGTRRRIRGAYLTRSPRQYVSEWGKPRWLPLRFWPANAPQRLGGRLATMAPQILAFLETDTHGANIGRDNPTLFPPARERLG